MGRGVLKAKYLEAMYENKLEFPGGRVQHKKPSLGGVWIFSGTAQCFLPLAMQRWFFLWGTPLRDSGSAPYPTWAQK